MDAGIVIALIALAGALASAALSLYGQQRSTTLATRREAEAVLAKYREPLAAAAYELQSRLYNILELDFLRKYLQEADDAKRTYAVENTLYVVGQYFAWSEIMRREIQFLSFSDLTQTRVVAERQRRIVELFQSDDPRLGRPFLVWRGEQRAIGELMSEGDGDQPEAIGYARFLARREPEFRRWFERLRDEMDELVETRSPRLVALQHALVDLVRELDPHRLRYADEILRKVDAA